MKIRKIMSGMMAGVMTVSSAVVLQMPAAAENVSVISSQTVASWDPLDVDLTSAGILGASSAVKITCTVENIDLLTEKGEVPVNAFGVVIGNNWNQSTMPHVAYNSSSTEFSITLNREEMNYQPVFQIQNQLPCEAVFTVEAVDFEADARTTTSIDAQTENYTMEAFEDSGWLIGSNVGAEFSRQLTDIEYNTTTIAGLLEKYKSISCTGNPYYGDSAGAGSEAFSYHLYVDAKDSNDNTMRFVSTDAEYTAPSEFFVDTLHAGEADYVRNPDFADYVITGAGIEIGTKIGWDGTVFKSYALSDVIKNLEPGTQLTIEAVEDTRSTAALPAIDQVSMELTAYDGDGWLEGCFVTGDHVVAAPEGITYNETTVGQLRTAFKSFATTANTYFSDSVDAGADNFEYSIDLIAVKDENEVRFGNASFGLTSSGTVYVDNFDADGTGITTGTYDDYAVTAIIIKVQSKLGWNGDTNLCYALCDAIKNMTPGDTLTLNLKEDTRASLALTAITDKSVTLNVYSDDYFGTMVGGDVWYNNHELIGKTVSELLSTYKEVTLTAPGYFADSVDAGADAFVYAPTIRVSNEDDSDSRWLDWDKFALTEDGRMNLNQYTSWLEGCDDYTVKDVYVYFQAKTDETQIVNETLRGLELDTEVKLELKEDTRETLNAPALPINISMRVYQDEYNVGTAAEADVEITSLFNAATIGELFSKYNGVSVPAGAYYSDTLNLGADGFEFNMFFNGKDSNDNMNFGSVNGTFAYNEGGFFSFDDISYDGADSDTLNYIALNIRPKSEWNEQEQ
ncbi:MAG: hypothetical protein ACI4WS_13890, partial [Oscillospiraceae bacterium]